MSDFTSREPRCLEAHGQRRTEMGMRRFTRLTNAFSKKVENHAHALAIYFMHYNFARVHSTIRCSPAMAAGVSKTLMDLGGMVDVLEAWEANRVSATNKG